MQTALFDEKVLEVELDGMPRVYFSRLKDDFSDSIGDEDFVLPAEDDHIKGHYLTAMSHIVTLPLEPGLGNLHLRHSRHIVLRMFTNTFAIELATTFMDLAKVGDLPVLKLSFPTLARIVRNAREFWAKVPDSLAFNTAVEIQKELPTLDTIPIDISVKGMAFSVSKSEQKMFSIGAAHSLNSMSTMNFSPYWTERSCTFPESGRRVE